MVPEMFLSGFLSYHAKFLEDEELQRATETAMGLPIVRDRADIVQGTPCLLYKPPVRVHGQDRNQQRHVGFFGLPGVTPYAYSGQVASRQDIPDWLERILAAVNALLGTELNAVLVNRYEDGSQYIGAHQDSERGLVRGAPVVTITLGEPRKFRIRRKEDGRRVLDLTPAHGSLLVMHHQRGYTHEIPVQKTIRAPRVPNPVRVSLTLRQHLLLQAPAAAALP